MKPTKKSEYKRIGWMIVSRTGFVNTKSFEETRGSCIQKSDARPDAIPFKKWAKECGGRCEAVYIKVKK